MSNMLPRMTSVTAIAAFVCLSIGTSPTARPEAAETYLPMLQALEPAEVCVMDRAGSAQQAVANPLENWPGEATIGGNIAPLRLVYDPHPTFDGLAVDPENGVVVMTDENRHGVLVYDLTSGSSDSAAITPPRRQIFGPKADLGFMAGVTLDPVRREIYAVSNDGGGLTVQSYDAHGNVAPIRSLTVPHQSWGISLSVKRDEMVMTSQQNHGAYIFKRTASGAEKPLRSIRGPRTKLADPHGVVLDDVNNEIVVANHGNWTELRSYAADGPLVMDRSYISGKFYSPSLAVFAADANGNVAPVRVIEGIHTQLNWPMSIAVDTEANEIAVANYGTNAILIFQRTAGGDAAPIRVLGGAATGIVGPVGVGIDRKNGELWVANYGDHTAVVFDRTASGNVAPKRIIRNAPKGTPTTGFTNASAAAYDSKRSQLLVPN